MKLHYTAHFLRKLRKLSPVDQACVRATLEILEQHPDHPALHTHPLHGSKRGMYAITVQYDLRILYAKHEQNILLMLTVGTHDEVY